MSLRDGGNRLGCRQTVVTYGQGPPFVHRQYYLLVICLKEVWSLRLFCL
jgi:hypothetical protein